MEKKGIKIWTDAEEVQFLYTWRTAVNHLRKAKRNGHVYQAMAEELNFVGVKVTPLEIQRKVNNFTQRYRKERMLTGCSGGSSSEWKHFRAVHSIIGRFVCNDNSKLYDIFTSEFSENNKTVSESQDEDFHETEPHLIDSSFAPENNATKAELLTHKKYNILQNPPKKRKIHERSASSTTKCYIDAALEKLDNMTKKKNKPETEFDIYCKSVAKQLNDMPTGMGLRCQLKIQEVLTKFRLQNQFPTQSVHEMHYSNPTSAQSLPDDSMRANVVSIPIEIKYTENTLSP